MTNSSRRSGSTADRDQLISISQLSEENGLHENTIRGYIRNGRLPAVTIGPRLIRVRRSDFDAFLSPYSPSTGRWAPFFGEG